MTKRSFTVFGMALFFGLLAPLIQGCGGGCTTTNVTAVPICVTKGDPATAYLSSALNMNGCPDGWSCIPTDDKTPANQRLLNTCKTTTTTVGPGGVANPVVATGPVGRIPFAPVELGGARPAPVAPAPVPPANSCLSQCANPTGSDCIGLTLTADQNAAAASLANLVLSKPKQIETASLMQIFRVGGDPCRRGVTSYNGARVVNTGLSCVISAPVSVKALQAGTPVTDIQARAQIELPTTVEAAAVTSGSNNVFRFVQVSQRPSVNLLNATASGRGFHKDNARFGGAILSLEANDRQLFLRTSTACVGLSYINR